MTARCGGLLPSRFRLTCALLMTSSHSEGQVRKELLEMSSAYANSSQNHTKFTTTIETLAAGGAPVQPGGRVGGGGGGGKDPFGDLNAFKSLTQREREDMNSGDANNSHFGSGPNAASDAAPKRSAEEERARFKLRDSDAVSSNICFDFSNGDCRRGAGCRFEHVAGKDGGGASAGRLCYHCNKRGHTRKTCPKKLAEEDALGPVCLTTLSRQYLLEDTGGLLRPSPSKGGGGWGDEAIHQ